MNNKGFTLIELLIVLSIIGIIGAIAIGGMSGFNVEEKCLKAGYPEYKQVGWKGYCIKTVNNTDIVVPVEEIMTPERSQ